MPMVNVVLSVLCGVLCCMVYTTVGYFIECVRLAAPEDGPLGSKHVVLYMLTNNCCVDSGICIC
jgi:hypothetical protein